MKPSTAQSKFINAIIKRGGANVPGPVLFSSQGGVTVNGNTLQSVQDRGWVRRDERVGVAYWTVTGPGRDAITEKKTDTPRNAAANAARLLGSLERDARRLRSHGWKVTQPGKTDVDWRAVADDLAWQLAAHAYCEQHPADTPAEECAFCADRAAYARYQAAQKEAK